MRVEGAGRTSSRFPPGRTLVAVPRMLAGRRINTRLLATFHLLFAGIGLIGRLVITAAATLALPLRLGSMMLRMIRIRGLRGGRLRGDRGRSRNRNCGDKHFHCSFSRRLFGLKLLETGVEADWSRQAEAPQEAWKAVPQGFAGHGPHRSSSAALSAEPPRRLRCSSPCRPFACRVMSRARRHNAPYPSM